MPESQPITSSQASTTEAQDYEKLLLAAQEAQAAADASVAELASLRRRLAEGPAVLQQRTDELTRARAALAKAEADLADARQHVSRKQAEAARLIEQAAQAQQALARALVNQEAADPAALEVLAKQIQQENTPVRPVNVPMSYDRAMSDEPRPWTPPPSPAAVNDEIVTFMADRDALCPSCGRNLRGVKSSRCPGCRLQLSVPVLKSVAPRWWQASGAVWTVRVFTIIGLLITILLTTYALNHKRLPGCGVGSDCDVAFSSPWGRVMGIPAPLLALPAFIGLLAATFRVNMAYRDPVRRKAWFVIGALAFLIAGASLWFIIVQLAIIKAVCPLCLVVDVIGLVIGVLVFFIGPMNRLEKVPPRASGRVTIAGPAFWKLAGASALVLGLFITAHAAGNARSGQQDQPIVGQPEQNPAQQNPKVNAGGLLMGEVDVVPNADRRRPLPESNTPTPRPEPKVNTPSTTPSSGLTLPTIVPEQPKSETPASKVTPTPPTTETEKKVEPAKKEDKAPVTSTPPGLLLPTIPDDPNKK